jgi:hypothetical protein
MQFVYVVSGERWNEDDATDVKYYGPFVFSDEPTQAYLRALPEYAQWNHEVVHKVSVCTPGDLGSAAVSVVVKVASSVD